MMAFKNGRYIDSGLPQEERERIDREVQEANARLNSWDDVPLTAEDQNSDTIESGKQTTE